MKSSQLLCFKLEKIVNLNGSSKFVKERVRRSEKPSKLKSVRVEVSKKAESTKQ
jgi:hypothetical protein